MDDIPHDPQPVQAWPDGEEPAGTVRVGFVERADARGCQALPQEAAAWRLRVTGHTDGALHAVPAMARPGGDEAGASQGAGDDRFPRPDQP